MCTAVSFYADRLYFGRTLDYESSYGEEIVLMPRRFKLHFTEGYVRTEHYAMLGVAHVAKGYPLYYDAINEKGLAMAGLNFVGYTRYGDYDRAQQNIAQFELIPWVLGQCADTQEAELLLRQTNITATPFAPDMPAAQLHWMLADSRRTLVVECVSEGVLIDENPAGVLTNNPPFRTQMFRLNDFMGLSPKQPENQFGGALPLTHYSRGMGALGLPGDLSSQSRFVRAAFMRANALPGRSAEENVSQVFHILSTVEQIRGCCEVERGEYEYTQYMACADAGRGIYYYTGYHKRGLSAVRMKDSLLCGENLARYPMLKQETIEWQN